MVSSSNLFSYSSPPKAVSGQGVSSQIRQWVKNGDFEKLENLLLEGQGARLLGLYSESAELRSPKIRGFLKSIPGYMAKVDLIHDAVIRGSLRETQALLDKKKLAVAKDAVGRSLIHKSVLYSHKSIAEWLGKKFPETLNLKDSEYRTCLHYAAASVNPTEMYDTLLNLGANPAHHDIHGRKAIFYIEHPEELDIEGPRNYWARGKKRKISPIQIKTSSQSGGFTRAQIRIWIHEKDIGKLEKIVWAGHGDKLLLETTNNARVKKFLENVPHLLSLIKEVHVASKNNDVNALKELKRRTDIREVFTGRDTHGLTPLHKASGLGNRAAVEFILSENRDNLKKVVNEIDRDGKIPLHFAAPLRDSSIYNMLIRSGTEIALTDNKGKTADYYRTHSSELDLKNLRHIPDAPRVFGLPTGWDRYSPAENEQVAGRKSGGGGGDRRGLEKEIDENENEFDFITGNNENNSFDINGKELDENVNKSKENENLNNFNGEDEKEKLNSNVNNTELDEKGNEIDDDEELRYNYSTKYQSSKDILPIQTSPSPPPKMFEDSVNESQENNKKTEMNGEEEEEDDLELQFDREEEEIEDNPEENATLLHNHNEKENFDEFGNYSDDLDKFIKEGNLEELVNYVIDGKGGELIGRTCPNSVDVQEFIDSIPAYMAKIASIHSAAETGRLKDLQSLLDRKRLAEAKDENGLCPLHKAILSGQDKVARYLASNFPTCLSITDVNGRSPLHYAAIMNTKEGELYRALIKAGSNPNIKDVLNNSPGIYLRNKDIIKPNELILKKSPEVWERPPTPSDNSNNITNNNNNNAELFQDFLKEGISLPSLVTNNKTHNKINSNYTNSNIPRYKGISTNNSTKAYSYNISLKTATYHMNSTNTNIPSSSSMQMQTMQSIQNISSSVRLTPPKSQIQALENLYANITREEYPWEKTWRKITQSELTGDPVRENVRKHLGKEIFDRNKTKVTSDGKGLYDILRFFPQYFLVSPNSLSYTAFHELFFNAINGIQHINPSTEKPSSFFLDKEVNISDGDVQNVDIPSKFVKQVRLRLIRNIKPFPFMSSMTKEEMAEVGHRVKDATASNLFNWVLSERFQNDDKAWRPQVVKLNKHSSKFHSFAQKDNFSIWINGMDHLEFCVSSKYCRLSHLLKSMHKMYQLISSKLDFHWNSDFGFLTSDPLSSGTGMKITIRIRLPTLMKKPKELKSKCDELRLNLKLFSNNKRFSSLSEISPESWVEIENLVTVGNEIEIAKQVSQSLISLIQFEEKLSRN